MDEKKQVKNRWLSISKCKINIPKLLDYKSYSIALMVDVYSIDRPDLNEGDTIKDENGNDKKVMYVDVIYKAKATGELIISDEHDKVYIKTDKRSQSQLLRGQIINTCKVDIPVDEHYKKKMIQLRHFWYLIDNYLDTLELKEKAGEL